MAERDETIIQLTRGQRAKTSPVPDFHIIYFIGRILRNYWEESGGVCGKYIYRKGQFGINGITGEHIRKLQQSLGIIIDLADLHFETSFLELSLFDPDDNTCRSFYTVLVGDEQAIEKYMAEMDSNLAAAKQGTGTRGLILPNPLTYETPLYGARYKRPVPCVKLQLAESSIFFGVYSVPEELERNYLTDSPEEINKFTLGFFDEVMVNALKTPDGEFRADAAFLVPISRPAGPVDGDFSQLRGGGLFIFGKWKDENDYTPGRFALLMSNALNRAVMKVSYTSFEHTRELDRQSKEAYIAQAHEGRKVISLIDGKTPAPTLEHIKQYFNTLYASTYDVELLEDTPGALPPEFARGSTFREFAINTMRIAGRIEFMVEEVNKGKPPETEEQLEAAADRAIDRIDFDESCNLELRIEEQIDFKRRWALCSALICVFRNIHKNGEPDTPIRLTISHDKVGPVLIISNKGRGLLNGVTGEKVPAAKPPGKTLEAIRYFVSQYAEDGLSGERIRMGWVDESDLEYETVMPLPRKDFGAKNLKGGSL